MMIDISSKFYEFIEGSLEKILYLNEENNWVVAIFNLKDQSNSVKIVGNLIHIQPGESLRLYGRWIIDKRYGKEFKVEHYHTITPYSIEGIERYLGSGLIKGIGPELAKRIVNKFKISTLEVIENSPRSLLEVEGIGEKKLSLILNAWKEQKEIRDIMVFLQQYGISSNLAIKIYKQFKEQTISIIKENPYELANLIEGVGFKTADKIGQNMGINLNSPVRVEAGILYILKGKIEEGHIFYPLKELQDEVIKELLITPDIFNEALYSLVNAEQIIIEESYAQRDVYYKPLHVIETNSAQLLIKLKKLYTSSIKIDIGKKMEELEKKEGIKLAEQQKKAIQSINEEKITVITGGPGTGKTTIIRSIIDIFKPYGFKFLLCAPTGRAAKRLSETTNHEAKTIHRLLEFSPKIGRFQRDSNNPLNGDIIVLDEASMVDLPLFYNLLKAIPLHARFVIVGDVDQLPSVGPGNVLKNIIDSNLVNVIRLNEIFRQAKDSLIVVNAHRINQGYLPYIKCNSSILSNEFCFIEEEDPDKVVDIIKNLVSDLIPQKFKFDSYEDIQVLTPMHKGIVGSINLNSVLQNHLNKNFKVLVKGSRLFKLNDKVMQIKNNYTKNVFNGDIGRIFEINNEDQEVYIKFDDNIVKYDFNELDEIVLAYSISIHKGQGSEYKAVIIPLLTQHYLMLQRNLLYTGITRGKKLVILVGSKKALGIAVKNNKIQERFTHLKDKLLTFN